MKHRVKSDGLGDPTIERLFQMYHDSSSLLIIKKQTAELIIKLNANPDDPTNMAFAGVAIANEPQQASTAPMEEASSGPLVGPPRGRFKRRNVMNSGRPRLQEVFP